MYPHKKLDLLFSYILHSDELDNQQRKCQNSVNQRKRRTGVGLPGWEVGCPYVLIVETRNNANAREVRLQLI